MDQKGHNTGELRLFLEEICVELCRHEHETRDALAPDQVTVTREYRLAGADAFADIRVEVPGKVPYFVEIKWGYDHRQFLERLLRKYTVDQTAAFDKLVVVTDLTSQETWEHTFDKLRAALSPALTLEIWSETDILEKIKHCFQVEAGDFTRPNYRKIRDAILQAEWEKAFGSGAPSSLAATLLWHFSPRRLREIHKLYALTPDQILAPNIYGDLVIVLADMCSFSSYVRDTEDQGLVREMMTVFYSQARQAVIDCNGMMDKFVGDEVIGIFGFPTPYSGDADDALRCARRLIDIGTSVEKHWQARIDRVQKKCGLHVGIGTGALNLMPLRAFSSSHVGFIGDAINMTARLMSVAGENEIVVSNRLYNRLRRPERSSFQAVPPVEAKNMGEVLCWRMAPEATRVCAG